VLVMAALLTIRTLTILAGGFGISGPDQDFTVAMGSTWSSYISIWNDEPTEASFEIAVEGNASLVVEPERNRSTIPPGSWSVIALRYSAQKPGRYHGWLCVKPADGGMLVPVARKEIQVVVTGAQIQVNLAKGLNLIGWCADATTIQSAFQQSPTDTKVTKIWRRETDGTYTFTQYNTQQNTWWSPNPSFTQLEPGHAYFIEATKSFQLEMG